MPYPEYQLGISHVDGETGMWMQSSNKRMLRWFLSEMDHEGSAVSLVKHAAPEEWITIDDADKVYEELND